MLTFYRAVTTPYAEARGKAPQGQGYGVNQSAFRVYRTPEVP